MALTLVLGENETPPERLTVTAACTLDEVDGAPRITTSALTVRGYVPRLDTATLERNSRRRRNSARCRTRCAATSPSPSAKCSTGTELAEVGVSRTAPPTSRSRLDQAHDRIALLRIDPKPAKLWPKLFRTGWGLLGRSWPPMLRGFTEARVVRPEGDRAKAEMTAGRRSSTTPVRARRGRRARGGHLLGGRGG